MGQFRKYVEIDSDKLVAFMQEKGLTQRKLAEQICRSESYIVSVIKDGRMAVPVYNFLLNSFSLPEGTFVKQPEPEPEPPLFVKPDQTSGRPHEHEDGYWLRLKYSPTQAKVQLMFGDEVVMGGISKIKGKTRLDFAQAVSYATHMVYKFLEQKELEEKEGGAR